MYFLFIPFGKVFEIPCHFSKLFFLHFLRYFLVLRYFFSYLHLWSISTSLCLHKFHPSIFFQVQSAALERIALVERAGGRKQRAEIVELLLMLAAGIGLSWLCWVVAIAGTTLSLASILSVFNPFILALAGHVIYAN